MNTVGKLNQTGKVAVLQKILIKPSKEIKSNRFARSTQAKAAPCSGKCASGSCR